jgi:hypothetical protein
MSDHGPVHAARHKKAPFDTSATSSKLVLSPIETVADTETQAE